MRATQAREPRLERTLASQPQRPHRKSKVSHKARRSSDRGVRGVSTHRTAPITNRHDPSWFESFRSYFALFWSFWLAISEPGWTSRKNKPQLEFGLNTPPQVKCGFALARSGYAQYPAYRGRAFVWLGFRRMQSDFLRAGRPVGHSAKFLCKIGLKTSSKIDEKRPT